MAGETGKPGRKPGTGPLAHVTTLSYTSAGLIATITDPQSNVTSYQYDTRGNRTSVTDALRNQTTFGGWRTLPLLHTSSIKSRIEFSGAASFAFFFSAKGADFDPPG